MTLPSLTDQFASLCTFLLDITFITCLYFGVGYKEYGNVFNVVKQVIEVDGYTVLCVYLPEVFLFFYKNHDKDFINFTLVFVPVVHIKYRVTSVHEIVDESVVVFLIIILKGYTYFIDPLKMVLIMYNVALVIVVYVKDKNLQQFYIYVVLDVQPDTNEVVDMFFNT